MFFSPEWVGLTQDAGDLFKDIKDEINKNSISVSVYRRKVKISINKIFNKCIIPKCCPKVIVFLKRSNKEILKISKIPKNEIIFPLLRENVILLNCPMASGLSKKHLSTFMQLISQVNTYRLDYSLNRLSKIGSLIKTHLLF